MEAVVSTRVVRSSFEPIIKALKEHGYHNAATMVQAALQETLMEEEWVDVADRNKEVASRLLDIRDVASANRDLLFSPNGR